MALTTIDEVHRWLYQLQVLAEKNSCVAPEFLRPFHLITLALLMKEHRATGLEIPDHLIDYANRMRLWHAVGLGPPREPLPVPDGAPMALPIERLVSRDAVDDCSGRLCEVAHQAQLDALSHRSLDIAVAELVDNCFAHAGLRDVDLHGLACAQTWPGIGIAQIAIADRGIGIRSSMEAAETAEVRDTVRGTNACELATQLGVTSKPSQHAGYGLALARQLIQRNGGTLVVLSGHEWFVGSGPVTQSGDRGVHWPGTLIVCEFNTDRPIRSQEVYDSWPEPVRGYSNDDFDF